MASCIITFSPGAWDDYLNWNYSDEQIWKKINHLVKEICRDPFKGEGKPEPLKGNFKGYWSRRITGEHRLIYKYETGKVVIIYCKGHYVR